MKVYESNNFSSPLRDHDMEIVLNYLNENGKVFVGPKTIEKLYEEFSMETHYIPWKTADNDTLWLFANWLEEYDYKE